MFAKIDMTILLYSLEYCNCDFSEGSPGTWFEGVVRSQFARTSGAVLQLLPSHRPANRHRAACAARPRYYAASAAHLCHYAASAARLAG